MKSVGEVMAIGRTFEESLQKAIRMIDPRYTGFEAYVQPEDLDHALRVPTDTRLFAVAHAMYNKNYSVDQIHEITRIDKVSSALAAKLILTTLHQISGSCIRSTTSSAPLEQSGSESPYKLLITN